MSDGNIVLIAIAAILYVVLFAKIILYIRNNNRLINEKITKFNNIDSKDTETNQEIYVNEIIKNKFLYAKVSFIYKDREGKITNRTASVNMYKNQGQEYLQCYCYLRNQLRTFIARNMSNCVDIDTGEKFNNVSDLMETKLSRTMFYKMFEYDDLLSCLVFIAKADKRITRAEKDIISLTASELTGKEQDKEQTDYWISISQDLTPSSFNNYVMKVVNNNDVVQFDVLMNAAEKILSTRKTPDNIQTAFYDSIKSIGEKYRDARTRKKEALENKTQNT
ncbi:MAG: hypothetical protein HQL95_08160 [Magnetococcales bacterium]|nr:hypothetical protein [Magnetococcales bacterium]